jgi:hypothetical protein
MDRHVRYGIFMRRDIRCAYRRGRYYYQSLLHIRICP